MSVFNFGKKVELPCKKGICEYEYGMTDRDIEGMPFPKSKYDKRRCPKYGHICPKFMEDFNLSVDGLNIRATIHCGFSAYDMIQSGELVLEEREDGDAIRDLLERGDALIKKYPPKEFPQYY